MATVYIYRGEIERIGRVVCRYPQLETGGSLYGFYTRSGDTVLHVATGPGQAAIHEVCAFFQDEAYMVACHRVLFDLHGLQHVGEYHSHHHLGLATPSAGDERTLWRVVDDLRWPRFICGIACFIGQGEEEIELGFYDFDAARRTAARAEVRVLEGDSPFRRARLRLPPGEPPSRAKAPRVALDPTARGAPWYERDPMPRRLAAEYRGLQALARSLGRNLEFRTRRDEVVIRLEGATPVELTLRDGFPRLPPYRDHRPLPGWDPGLTLAEALASELPSPPTTSGDR